jgi:hypothetical protein
MHDDNRRLAVVPIAAQIDPGGVCGLDKLDLSYPLPALQLLLACDRFGEPRIYPPGMGNYQLVDIPNFLDGQPEVTKPYILRVTFQWQLPLIQGAGRTLHSARRNRKHLKSPRIFGHAKRPSSRMAFCLDYCRRSPNLPHSHPCSTIGPARLNFRVRDGNG